MWNEKNLFTGCVDVPLTKKGVEEAIEAGKRISNIPVDMIYTSSLIRAQMTAMLAMTEHRRKKVFLKKVVILLIQALFSIIRVHMLICIAIWQDYRKNSKDLVIEVW